MKFSSFKMQNPEPAVDFDTVANKKQQHEVNVGTFLKPVKHPLHFCIAVKASFKFTHSSFISFQPYQTHLASADTTRLWPFLHSSPDNPACLHIFVEQSCLFSRVGFFLLLLSCFVFLNFQKSHAIHLKLLVCNNFNFWNYLLITSFFLFFCFFEQSESVYLWLFWLQL